MRCGGLLRVGLLFAMMGLPGCGPGGAQPGTEQKEASQSKATRAETAGQSESALYLVHSARIYAFDPGLTLVEDGALAISEDGAILTIGQTEPMQAMFPGAEQIDLQGQTVLPGLIDAHGHLAGPGGYAASLTEANLVGTTSKPEILARLQEFAATLGPEDWLEGFGWDQNDWPESDFPSRADLDAAFSDRPVWLIRIDGHAGWANSAALAQADRDFSGGWNPQGGLIHRDVSGAATGILIDNAMALVDDHVPPLSPERLDKALDLAIETLLGFGLTGVHDVGLSRADMQSLQDRIATNRLPLRIYAMADGVGGTLDWLCDEGPFVDPSGRLEMRAVKLYADGALGSRGAALLDDYSDEPGNRGLLFNEDAVLREHIRRTLSCGLQAGIHAIGDGGNRQVLDAFAALGGEFPDNPGRHRIEHVQVLAPSDIPRLAQLGVIASMQPTHATSDMYWVEKRLGAERVKGAYAWRSLLDNGAKLAFGSDFPVEAANPMLGIYAAVSRRDLKGWPEGGWHAEQKLSREEAIQAFTLGAAYAAFMEDRVGSLETGKRADFIVLDRDPLRVPEAEIPQVRVLQTWVDGVRVFSRP